MTQNRSRYCKEISRVWPSGAGISSVWPNIARLAHAAEGMWRSGAKARGTGTKLRKPGRNFRGGPEELSGGSPSLSGGAEHSRSGRGQTCDIGTNARYPSGASAKRAIFRVTGVLARDRLFRQTDIDCLAHITEVSEDTRKPK